MPSSDHKSRFQLPAPCHFSKFFSCHFHQSCFSALVKDRPAVPCGGVCPNTGVCCTWTFGSSMSVDDDMNRSMIVKSLSHTQARKPGLAVRECVLISKDIGAKKGTCLSLTTNKHTRRTRGPADVPRDRSASRGACTDRRVFSRLTGCRS